MNTDQYLDDMSTISHTLRLFMALAGRTDELLSHAHVFGFLASLGEGATLALGEECDVAVAAETALPMFDRATRDIVGGGLSKIVDAASSMITELFAHSAGIALDMSSSGEIQIFDKDGNPL